MDDMRIGLKSRLEWILATWKRRIRFSIGKRLPPRGIAWKQRGTQMLPVCPRCGDYVYYTKQCFCGQRLLPGAKTIGEVLDHGHEE